MGLQNELCSEIYIALQNFIIYYIIIHVIKREGLFLNVPGGGVFGVEAEFLIKSPFWGCLFILNEVSGGNFTLVETKVQL